MLSILLIQSAMALDCEDYPLHWPYFHHTDLPLNTKVLIQATDSASIVLGLRKEGEENYVEGTWVEIQSGVYHFETLNPLESETPYELFDTAEGAYARARFTTGDLIDEQSPPTPILGSMARETGEDEWGPWDYRNFTFETDGCKY